MKEIYRAQRQVTFRLPNFAADPTDLQALRRRGRQSATDIIAEDELNTLIDALIEPESSAAVRADMADNKPRDATPSFGPSGGGISVVDAFTVDLGEPPSKPARRGARAGTPVDFMQISVNLAPDEDAVILIEQEGSYEWHFAESADVKLNDRQRRGPLDAETGDGYGALGTKSVTFNIPIGEGESPRPPKRGGRAHRGVITNFIKGKVKGFILKFVAKKLVGALSRRIERGVTEGPVVITSSDADTGWEHRESYRDIQLPSDRAARILLMVHGTFSSTLGSFSALSVFPEGQQFLNQALQQYDAVIGYDHYTLSETPAQNAEALYAQLQVLLTKTSQIEIDAISFSRGGLVYRYLSEQIVPSDNTDLLFRKAVFVGCTNDGTELANDDNWKELVDFYTNMVAGATRLLGLAPGAALPARIFRTSIQMIGSLVTYIAQEGVANNSVPGLAAMEPAGDFVRAMNAMPVARNQPGARSYYAMGSSFEPTRDRPASALGNRVIARLADGVLDRLMGKDNDLVVHTDSMFVIDPVPSAKLIERREFDDNGQIYHTVYFNQPLVATALSQWLGLVKPTPQTRAPGQAPRDWWASVVNPDFMRMPATTSGKEAVKRLRKASNEFVVLQRMQKGKLFNYGIPRSDLLDSVKSVQVAHDSVVDILGLHEFESSAIDESRALAAGSARKLIKLAANRENESYLAVVVDGREPVGVVSPPVLESTEAMIAANRPPRKRGARRSATATPTRGSRAHDANPAVDIKDSSQSALNLVLCHVHAMMPEQVAINKTASVEVTLSRDLILREAGISGSGELDADKSVIVQVFARKQCVVTGESREQTALPEAGKELTLFFDITAKHPGIGEVDVIVRQGNRAIVSLKLKPKFTRSVPRETVNLAIAEADARPLDDRKELPNVLYIREGQMGNKPVLHFQFHSRPLNRIVECTSEPFRNATGHTKYINDLYKELEGFWASEAGEYQAFMNKVQARGAKLFDELIPRELQELLWDAKDNIENIQVFADEPLIPWELAYLKQPGKKAKRNSCFLAEKGMVRWLASAGRYPPTRLRLREGKFGYIIPRYPNNSGYELPGAQVERKLLEDQFGAKAITATSNKVQATLETPGAYDILHFACHGIADTQSIWNAGLLMKGAIKGGSYKQDRLLADQIDAFADLREEDEPGPLVFLNACQTGRRGDSLTNTGGFARAFLNSGADAFIGAHWSVGDTSALKFSETLYKQLLKNENMMTAVAAARTAAKNNEELSWLAYVVYADPYAVLGGY